MLFPRVTHARLPRLKEIIQFPFSLKLNQINSFPFLKLKYRIAMAYNVFKFCSNFKFIGSAMILIVLGIVSVTYYSFVISLYFPAMFLGGIVTFYSFVMLLVFHILLFMLLWCYFSAVFSDPGYIPENWQPISLDDIDLESQKNENTCEANIIASRQNHDLTFSASETENFISESENLLQKNDFVSIEENKSAETSQIIYHEKNIPSSLSLSHSAAELLLLQTISARKNAKNFDQVRQCRKCNKFKPPRCHHCSVCKKCILKMDHHCIWIVNCVGAKNYKFFLLFIFYTFLETTFTAISLLPIFLQLFNEDDLDKLNDSTAFAFIFLSFVLNLAFSLSLFGFIIMHFSLVSSNTTTIEAYEKKVSGNWNYDLGRRKNFEQVFGSAPLYWFLPLYSKYDLQSMPALSGVDFPEKEEAVAMTQS